MSKSELADLEVGAIYATFWRMVYMSVHRYGSNPTGELLTVMTITLLDKAGYNPTTADLVEITGLAKSNVSRYVSRQIKNGFLHICRSRDSRSIYSRHQDSHGCDGRRLLRGTRSK